MSINLKYICIGHKPPNFKPPIDYLMVCPESLGLKNELVISDERFGNDFDGASLAEYSQLFGLADLIKSGDYVADKIYFFQYRKFISPISTGYQSVAPWVRVLSKDLAINIFPDADFINNENDLIVGSIFDFGESISDNYSRVHVAEDFATFMAACAQSGVISNIDMKAFASMRGIIPSPALCCIKVGFFVDLMECLKKVSDEFMKNYHVKRTGYQSRSTGYLLERLHSLLICQKIMNASISPPIVWNRYVINSDI